MILSLSVVLLAASGYIHANQCNIGLANYMNTKCSNTKFKFHSLSECSFSCQGVNSQGQPTITTYYLVNGLPCGPCKECCDGRCTPVQYSSENPLTVKSCAK
uniref:Putative ixostatin n=1 Tax=Ixodes ricinus TaxID=34613 RepID=A0A0K8R4W3_IXORI